MSHFYWYLIIFFIRLCQKTDETFMFKNPTKEGKGDFDFSLDKGRHERDLEIHPGFLLQRK